jgi:geranylgeranyl reductase family protein
MRVVIAGAGPGGASAAIALARAGATVDLVERSAWPRAKTCGDGVSPLAIRTLHEIGVTVAPALELRRALVHTPRGTAFRGGWPDATPWGTIIERRAFDAQLVDAAIRAGATFVPATEVRAIADEPDGVAVTVRANGAERVLRADAAIVADGASGSLAKQLGFPPHRSRTIALRAYAPSRLALTAEYGLFYDRGLSPGYGWIFPVAERRANVGICVDERALARSGGDMRALLRRWLAQNRVARELLGDAPELESVSGGIIPSGRARRVRGRVFLIGDAAGVADPFTAEGIYEAIESGRLVAGALTAGDGVPAAAARYESALSGLDRNERAARALRATFNLSIEPYARYAALRPRFADRLMTDVFFAKPEFPKMMWNLHFGH